MELDQERPPHRRDGAPSGTPYACFICGYDTRHPIEASAPEGSGIGQYVEGIGVRHFDAKDCMTLMNRFLHKNERRPPYYEGDEVLP